MARSDRNPSQNRPELGDLITDQGILLGSTATGDINALLAVRCVSSGNCWASASWKA